MPDPTRRENDELPLGNSQAYMLQVVLVSIGNAYIVSHFSSSLSLCQLEVVFVAIERPGAGEAADFS